MVSNKWLSSICAARQIPFMVVACAAALVSACGGGGGGGGSGGGGGTTPPATYTVGGSVSGLKGSGLVLQDNGSNNLSVAADATTFTFSTSLAGGAAYSIKVLTQPTNPSQVCSVSEGSGSVASANVTSVSIACTSDVYTVGGTISGLTSGGLVLQDNGGNNLTVAANAKSFTFSTPVASGGTYAVTVLTQPASPSETCTVTGGTGSVMAANISSVSISCKTKAFTVGGTIIGLTSAGLVLQDNGGDNLTVSANATSFVFSSPVAGGTAYAVSVLTQPQSPPETCTVAMGSGTVGGSNVATVTISCKPSTFTVGGSITGLTSSGLVLQDNGGSNLTVAANASTFAFTPAVMPGTAYNVTVATQPGSPAQNCAVTSGSGTVGTANVMSVAITCHSFGRFLYVANSTDGTNANGEVAAFSINSADGTLTPIGVPVAADLAPSAVTVDPNGNFVYVSNRKSADVSVYAVDPVAGGLTLLNQTPDKGVFNTAMVFSPSGQYLFTGGTNSGGTSSVFAFTHDPLSGVLSADPNAPYGASNIPFGLAVDPTEQLLFATAQQKHEIHSFAIGTVATTLLSETANSPFTTPSQPYGVVVNPLGNASGGYVYVTDEGINKVSIFSYDNTGNMTELTGKPYYSPVSSGTQPEGLAIDPAGLCLYVANYGDGSVSSFSVAANGQLTGVQTGGSAVATGNRNGLPNPGPVDVKIDPAGPYVYVVNSLDGSVSLFTTSGDSGATPCTLTLQKTYLTGSGATGAAVAID